MPKPSVKPHLFKLLQDFQIQHPGKPVNLREIAVELGVTRQHTYLLYHQLSKVHSVPPLDYSTRGFGSMDKQKLKLITSKASKKAHLLGKAHKFTTEDARRAGKLGGRGREKKS